MADIVLAEHRGQTWLVSGEQYIDDLLANTLPGDISIEFIACQSDSDVTVLWVQNGAQPASAGSPWIINPSDRQPDSPQFSGPQRILWPMVGPAGR